MEYIFKKNRPCMNSFSIFFISLFLLRSLSTVSNYFSLSCFPFFSHFFEVTFNAILHCNLCLPRFQFPSTFWASESGWEFHSASFSYLQFFYMTSACTPHQFLLRTFLHSNLYSHFIHFLLSALLTPTIIITRSFFANQNPLLLFLC